ncbi:MAG: glycosyl hydrolase, partial [Saprospiraceae bacterium]|nr:glycosyl hydrolase [Saprospiraceae bacterium]
MQTQFSLPWVSLGPVINSARVESIQLDHQRPGTFYVAFGSGNLWKTTNHGVSWNPIFENLPSHGIGDIALAPSNPEVIYIGTRESLRKQRNFTLPGNGIYRSSNGGESWEHRGLDQNWHCGEIVVHPENPDIVFVAAMGKFWSPGSDQGIYKSSNGGISWKKVLYVNERTRANDIVIAPSKPSV